MGNALEKLDNKALKLKKRVGEPLIKHVGEPLKKGVTKIGAKLGLLF